MCNKARPNLNVNEESKLKLNLKYGYDHTVLVFNNLVFVSDANYPKQGVTDIGFDISNIKSKKINEKIIFFLRGNCKAIK